MRSRYATGLLPVFVIIACGTGNDNFNSDGGKDGSGGGDGGPTFGDTGAGDGSLTLATCADAATAKSYVGCDYWPTVTGNNVWSIFDYAVVVANASGQTASVTITGPNGTNQNGTVAAGQLEKFYLPWVTSLKGPDTDGDGTATAMTASVIAHGGAYHLVSSVPVSVYQFNALEYQPQGGPSGKNWSACPNDEGAGIQCFSYSNDASLLLPSTAMTNNYRVMGQKGWSEGGQPIMGPSFSITATANGTVVTVKTSASSHVLAGGGIPATNGVGTFTVALNQGDVAEVVGQTGDTNDFSGSLVQAQDAQHPIQLITSLPCINQPEGTAACDHIEESVFPAETLGQHYVVTVPTSPGGTPIGHIVRIFGNVDGTTLTYAPSKPAGCPATLNAGQVADCGQVSADFEVKGNNAFGVFSGMLGGTLVDPVNGDGDPSQSFMVAVEQYRTAYIFLAPSDYDISFVDIVGPTGVNCQVDGASVGAFKAIGASGYGVARYKLGAGNSGAHTLTSDKPVGIQVMGYGQYTSYQYPGGSDLTAIAPPPVK
ncbi:MAG TPA: IgGFc-binding protein [Polyangiaceae bacterium]|nr:IgGFc-binding protein [Polyangiaceae bacterium]